MSSINRIVRNRIGVPPPSNDVVSPPSMVLLADSVGPISPPPTPQPQPPTPQMQPQVIKIESNGKYFIGRPPPSFPSIQLDSVIQDE